MTLPVQVFTFVADEAVLVAVGVSDELINLLLSQLTVDDMTFNWPSSDLNVLGQLTVDVRQHKPQFLSWDVAGRWPCCDLGMTLVNPNVTSSHVLRCGRSLTLLWPTSVWPWLTPMWPHLMFWDVAGLWPCCDLGMTLVNPNVTSSHVLRCGRSLTLLWPRYDLG